MLNESLIMSQMKEISEKSMEIILSNLPQLNVKELKLPPKYTTDDGDTLTGIFRNTSISFFRFTFGTGTNLDHLVERKMKDLPDLDEYFSIRKSIKNLFHQNKKDVQIIN